MLTPFTDFRVEQNTLVLLDADGNEVESYELSPWQSPAAVAEWLLDWRGRRRENETATA